MLMCQIEADREHLHHLGKFCWMGSTVLEQSLRLMRITLRAC